MEEAAVREGDERPLRAVIFDLDGVLVDSEAWWGESRAIVARGHGGEWRPEDEASVKGHNTREWVAAMRERVGMAAADEAIEREVVEVMVARYATDGPVRIEPGLAAVRRLGRRYPLAVASSAHPAVIAAALRSLGLAGAFAAVVSSDEVGAGKPSPAVYLEAARRLGVHPGACLVIEDSSNGVRAARSAGMRVVWVGAGALAADHRGPVAPEPTATLRLATLDDLDVQALERWTEGDEPTEGRPR